MKVTDIEANVLESLEEGDVLAHGCNSFGVAGGFAGAVFEMFPETHKRYTDLCDTRDFRPGSLMYNVGNKVSIYNLGTQWKPGADAHITNIRSSVKEMLNFAAFRDQWVIKTVRLGCGIGGLDWEDVKPELEEFDYPVELQVYYMEM